MGGEDDKDKKWNPPPPQQKPDSRPWEVLAAFVICATATTFALTRTPSAGRGTFRTSFQEEAWRRYNKRMQEEYEDELERVARIRRMQSVFNRERNKFRRGYENWTENDPGAQQYHQQFQRHDWYWKTESSHRNQRTNHQEPSDQRRVYPLSHHYSVLGLSRSRATPYTEAEIKKAFREKALEFHPDQNQDNKIVAEAKFKESCLLCDELTESRDNLFYACPYSFTVWNYLYAMIGNSTSQTGTTAFIRMSILASLRTDMQSFVPPFKLLFTIFGERGGWKHHQHPHSPLYLAHIIDKVILLRIISRHKDLPEMMSPSFKAGLMSTIPIA
ncbi:unnamed protein product [Arabidopsis thaliana]|uniref:J domain-containing protein n=1 Tax=Arabidopsis thaliana TaxID=3702 RepID=A0A5S9XQM1_ARATH|nr:unnamed protein product [Arabidopsis thaliana]